MKISVVIPVRNEEKFLVPCLVALQNQQEKPDEIIVADADSQDKTVEIAKKFGVKVIEHTPSGIAKTRNAGFDAAEGDIIARCDADSIVPAFWVKRIKQDFNDQKIDALVGPIIYGDLPVKITLFSKIFIHLMNLKLHHHIIIGNNMAITKTSWDEVKPQLCLDDAQVHEDIDLSLHLHNIGKIIYYDSGLITNTSGRRIKGNPFSFFGEYPKRLSHMFKAHGV